MPQNKNARRLDWLRYLRLAVQIAAIVLIARGFLMAARGVPGVKPAFIILTILAGAFFCGWICPFGTAQEWLRLFGKNVLGVTWKIPARVDRYLSFSRYLVAALFFGTSVPLLFANSRPAFIMLLMGRVAAGGILAVMAGYLLLAVFVDRPYCKYACWFGAGVGFISMARFFGLRRNGEACLNCGKCDKACMMGVEVSALRTVRDPNCVDCGRCLAACPKPDALSVGFAPPSRADVKAMLGKYKRGGLEDTPRKAAS